MSKGKIEAGNNAQLLIGIGMVATVVASALVGAAAAGALGMSFALYGALIGGIIGFTISSVIDIPKEISTIIGVVVGAMIGIVGAKTQEDKKTDEIDNSDYLKGAKCAADSVIEHYNDAISCAGLNLNSCKKLFDAGDEITICMGEGSDGDVIV